MAEMKIYLTADAKSAMTGVNRVVASVESLRKQYITGKGSLENYNQALNDQLAHNREMLTPLKEMEANYKLLHTELSRLTLAFGENDSFVKQIKGSYEQAAKALSDYKAKLADANNASKLESESAQIKAKLEAEQKAINDSRTYYKALGDSMGYAQNEANILNNTLKNVIANGGDSTAINNAATAYLNQKDAIAEVARQEELYLAQVQNAINQEKAREQAIEDANNASLESWKRYTTFVEQQQAKLNALNAGSNPTEASMKMGNYSSSNANMAYYKTIGDEVGYAREEVSLYGNEIKRLISLEGDHSAEIANMTDAYKSAKARLDKLSSSSDTYFTKLVKLTKNIVSFQLLLQPIRKTISFVSETLKESVQVAAEAEQIFSKLSTVFAGLENSASSAANALASSIGVSKSSAASALSTVGDMLQAQGMGTAESLQLASEWVSKFQDIIAFKDINMDLAEFATNFMSGATGNLRNFRTFGSIVSESAVKAELAKKGIDGLSDSQVNLEKMVLRGTMALEQQANAIGAVNREWNTTRSITTRYTEQNKALMENIGDAINTKLNPLKNWWADIAEQINKAHDAQVQFNAGQKNISVYDINANESDYKSFRNEVINYKNAAKYTSVTGQVGYVENTAAKLIEIMTEFNATSTDVLAVWSNMPDAVKKSLLAQEEALEKQKAQEVQIKAWQESLTSVSESAIDLVNSLGEITGANTGTSGKTVLASAERTGVTTKEGYDSTVTSIGLALNTAIKNAISSFGSSDWSNYVSSMDIVFGTATESEGLVKKIEELQNLYSLISYQAQKDGVVTEQEQGYLDSILAIYDEILLRQQAITDEAQAQVELESILANTSDYEKQSAQLRMTDDEKALDDLKRAFDAIDKSLLSADMTKELNKAYEESVEALTKLQAEQKKYNEELEKSNKLTAYQEGTADYEKQFRQLRMTDAEKYDEDMRALLTGDEELDNAIKDQITAYYKLLDAQEAYNAELEAAEKAEEARRARQDAWQGLGQSSLNSLGTVGGAINTVLYGEGDIWTKLLTVCLDIFQQSEYWTDIVEQIDAVIEPLMPVVEAIFSVVEGLEGIFEIVAFVMKVISSTVVLILHVVNQIIDIFEWFWDNLKIALKNVAVDVYNLFHLKKKSREDYKSLIDYWEESADQTNSILNKIWSDMPTKDKDFATLENLLASNIIDLNQYNAGLRVANKDMIFDPVSPVGYVAQSGHGGSTKVTYGDVSVTINGGNAEETQRILIKLLRQAGYDVSSIPITA